MPLSRRIPELKGFTRAYFKTTKPKAILSLKALNKFDEGSLIDKKLLKEKRLIKNKITSVKIVNIGILEKKLNFKGLTFSDSAKKVLEKIGCEIK